MPDRELLRSDVVCIGDRFVHNYHYSKQYYEVVDINEANIYYKSGPSIDRMEKTPLNRVPVSREGWDRWVFKNNLIALFTLIHRGVPTKPDWEI